MATQTRPKPPSQSEAQKFTELARKLVSVPKQEADKQREAYEKRREHERGSQEK